MNVQFKLTIAGLRQHGMLNYRKTKKKTIALCRNGDSKFNF